MTVKLSWIGTGFAVIANHLGRSESFLVAVSRKVQKIDLLEFNDDCGMNPSFGESARTGGNTILHRPGLGT